MRPGEWQRPRPDAEIVCVEVSSVSSQDSETYMTRTSFMLACRWLHLPRRGDLARLASPEPEGLGRTEQRLGAERTHLLNSTGGRSMAIRVTTEQYGERMLPSVAKSGLFRFSTDDLPERERAEAVRRLNDRRRLVAWAALSCSGAARSSFCTPAMLRSRLLPNPKQCSKCTGVLCCACRARPSLRSSRTSMTPYGA